MVVAYAVHETGRREVIGIDLGETEAFWVEFLRSLRARGLKGVRLCTSDHHEGSKTAIARILDCPWQRCTVHFVRNMHGHCRRSERGLVKAALREIFDALRRRGPRAGPAAIEQRLLELFSAAGSAVLTNVPGPREPVHLAGTPVRGVLVWAPTSGSVSMSVSIFSYNGEVTVGVMSDRGLVPDPGEIVAAFAHEIGEMLALGAP